MTCIIGYVYDKKVYIGGDSLGVSGLDITERADPKVFINKDFIIGFTSSFRMGQLLMSSKFNPDPQESDQSDFDYMITTFIDHIRELFDKSGYMEKNNSQESGGVFLVGYNGVLYKIESDFQVGISCDDYAACGCGDKYAKGSLYTLYKQPYTVEEKIKIALDCASKFSGGVGGHYTILSK